MTNTYELIIQLIVATILGGLVGHEREGLKRPAGFRTHILVCLGATIAVQTNGFLIMKYMGVLNVDPARLGAQVISGLGFLGAGTIIKEGSSVKGLTTAASLWTMGIIGLAVGSGFYIPAVIGTIVIYITLRQFQDMERKIKTRKGNTTLEIIVENRRGLLGDIGNSLSAAGIAIVSVSTVRLSETTEKILMDVTHPRGTDHSKLIILISQISSVISVTTD
ncbi:MULTISPECIES: MgtC/SapB family protein [unclassified Fusibacter]|uniref:MgtC/SapB family protein n=1 Tax=unclassified Fusibacter TaxID=2624464 RepID=UPI0013E954E4|nr:MULTISPECIES: MgtC/SapB family protein [unclassified Fusibacter]MCK8060998.1 MgtC/SapB family protein [Fusibacter sp. A2]NPE20548.1 MgtC/SapB family protein [Fusibacter sp. A1]